MKKQLTAVVLALALALAAPRPASAQFPNVGPISYWGCTFFMFYIPISYGVIQASGLNDPSNVQSGTGTGWGDCQFLAVCYPQVDAAGNLIGTCS